MEQTKRKKMLVVLAAIVAFTMAFAMIFVIMPAPHTAYATNSTVTIDFTSKDFSNGQKVNSVEQDDITVAFSQGGEQSTVNFVKVTSADILTEESIGTCTAEEAKAWILANWDNVNDDVNEGCYADIAFYSNTGELNIVWFDYGANEENFSKYFYDYINTTSSISDLQEWFGDGDSVFICTAAAPTEPASETYTLEIMDSGFEPTYIRNFKLGETVTAHVDKWDGCTPGTPTTEDDNITDLSIDAASDSYIVTFKVTGVVASGGAMIMVPFNSIGGGSAGGKAVWVRFVTFITFEPNGGKFVYELPDDTTEEITVSVTMPCDLNSKLDSFGLVMDGYQFLGWFNASEGGEQKTAATADLDGTTLYAHWEEESGGNGDEPINFHTHDYATEWSKDENTHWHACLGEGDCDALKADEAIHTYGDDITATAYYTCSVCGYENGTRKTEYEAAQQPAHVHAYSNYWTFNFTMHWINCMGEGVCDNPKKDLGNHSYGEDISETTYYTCSVCGYTNNTRKNEYLAAQQPAHEHDYSEDWAYDANTHWHACLGEGDCDALKADEAIHTYGDDITATAYYTCSVCGYENGTRKTEYETAQQGGGEADVCFGKVTDDSQIKSENIDQCTLEKAKGWVTAFWDDVKNTDATHMDIAYYDGTDLYVIYITASMTIDDFYSVNAYKVIVGDLIVYYSIGDDVYLCGFEGGSQGSTHVHSYDTDWSSDISAHWHACIAEGICDEPTKDVEAHTYGDDISETSYYACSVCGYADAERKAEYEAAQQPAHVHAYSNYWTFNFTMHWINCMGEGVCDNPKKDLGNHSYGEDISETTYYTCSVCGYENSTRKTEYENAQQGGSGSVEPVLYLDENGETQICTDYTVINDDTTDLTEGWYVVTSDVTSVDRISIRGDVKIIICDGKTLTNYYYINCWYYEIDSLTVYVQSTGENMGSLVVDNSAGDPSFTAIDVINVIINGGNIIAKGNNGIEAGELTINGGNVTAIALNEYSQGIRAENAVVTNGKVFATGQFGINGPITIYGGEVYAEGTVYGLYIFSRGEAKAPVQGDISINGGFVTAVGNIQAISGTVKNAVPGTGWTNTDGTEGQTAIDVNTEGRDFSETGYRKVQFLPVTHTHAFSYSANGATITATCGNVDCDITEGLTLTINAPTGNMVYDGKVRVATIAEGYSDVAFPNASIVYYKNNAVVDSCVEIGTYTAKVTFDDATSEITFTIENWTMDDPENEEVTVVINGAEFDEDVQLKVEVKAEIATDETQGDYTKAVKEKIAENEEVAIVYEVKLLRLTTVGGQETLEEIQPSDIKEGTTLTISMKIPENLKGKNFRLLHIHNAGDVSEVAYTVSENGEYITVETDRLSEFAFLIEVSQVSKHGFCISWIAFILACLALVFFLVWLLLGKKELLKLIGLIASCAVLVFAIIVIIVHTCIVSIIALILAIIAVALFALFFFLFKDKNEKIKKEISATLTTDEKDKKKETESFDEANDGIGLKESLAMAATATRSEKITKAYVRAYLTKNYPDSVEVNARVNFTKTGLPLADTHYVKTEDNKTCFIYVYETEGATMLLLKTKDELGEELAKDYKTVRKSVFPKAKDKWYSVVIDDSLSNEQVEDMIDKTIAIYAGATIPKKPVKPLTTVKKVTVAEASALIEDEVAATYIEVDKNAGSHIGKKDIVNVDTLSYNFNDGDTVTIEALKEKKLVPAKSKQVKLLARGSLDKKLFIELQDYSIEAVKMVIATGGTVKKV